MKIMCKANGEYWYLELDLTCVKNISMRKEVTKENWQGNMSRGCHAYNLVMIYCIEITQYLHFPQPKEGRTCVQNRCIVNFIVEQED